MVLAARIFNEVTTENGFTLNVPKTKLLIAQIGFTDDDLAPLEFDDGVVEVVEQLMYLGSLMEACSEVVKVSCKIAQASEAFGSLLDFVFTASDLTMETKRMVY